MAPPNRRPSYSRRAQYTTFFGYLAGVLGALLGGALLIVSIANPSAFSGLRNVASDATSPASSVVSKGRSQSRGFMGTVSGYLEAGRQNALLKRELEAAKIRLIEAQAQSEENKRLKALLKLAETEPRSVAVARIVASTASSTRRFATLSAGENHGVAVGMPVRSPMGLIGRVLEVGSFTSRVLLITDPQSVVPVRRASDGVAAFAQGRTDGSMQIKLIGLGINPLKVGDTLVTSGSGGLYRPGTPIGVVVSLTRDGAIARLLSDPAVTEYVAIEPVWAPEAAEPIYPKPSTPGATPAGGEQ
jgi:rod shape-determining protein MreC